VDAAVQRSDAHAGGAMKLGKLAPRHDHRTALLYNFVDHAALPDPAPIADWATRMPDDLGVMLNDQIGDCGFAGQAHLVQLWTSNNGQAVTISDDDVLAAYRDCTGYDPADPSTDNGVVLLDALNFWRTDGIGNHRIGAYVKVNHLDIREVRIALQLFGGLYTGVQLPEASLASVGSLWGDASGPIAGGHCMAAYAQRPDQIGFVTWGKRQSATWPWALSQLDEAYAIISADWVDGTKPAPSGFAIDKLRTYLAAL
jgi:hypothetical protein